MEDVTVTLKLPKRAYEFASFMAAEEGISIDAYLLSAIKDLLIGELVDLAEYEPAEGDKVLGEYLGEPLTESESASAPRVAEKLGMRDFLTQPHHSGGWDLNALDMQI